MLTLRAIHAHEGDCLLLIHGAAGDRFVLVDGGPKETFGPHLKQVLAALPRRKLEAICLSHVDTDHTTGLMELLAELRDQRDDGDPLLVEVDAFWINEFEQTIDGDNRGRRGRLEAVIAGTGPAGAAMRLATAAVQGIKHGHDLVVIAKQLGIPINAVTAQKPFLAGTTGAIPLGDLSLTVVGPTAANLDALRVEWEDWLSRQEDRISRGAVKFAAMADQSVPNLSSIQLLAESGGKRLLLTGDGRGDHLLDALEDTGLLDDEGGIDVDVLKVPHHGSDRNVNRAFFERVRAATYVISADGKHGNPDGPTLEWIWKAAKKQGRKFELVLTNLPEDAQEFVQEHPPGNEYTLRVRKDTEDFIDVPIA